jgi:uracil DNA glycosylase
VESERLASYISTTSFDDFNALNSTQFFTLKAIISGQDPYRSLGQAMKLLHLLPREMRMRSRRLSFPAPRGVKAPCSLVNTYIQAGFGVFDSVSWESGETGCSG